MKGLRSIVINLSLVLLITGVLPSLVLAAHDENQSPATAETAAAGGEQDMRNFVAHARAHLNEAAEAGINDVAQFREETRKEGVWKNGSTYLIQIEKRGSVLNHGEYTEALYGDFINDFPTVKSLTDKLEDGEDIPCEMDSNSYACAAYYNSPFGAGQNIVIGGFDHEEVSDHVKPLKCDGYKPVVTARELQERQDSGASKDALKEDLQILVRDAILWASKLPPPGMADNEHDPDILSGVRCFTKGGERSHWKHESIYFFVMTAEKPAFVAVNGNNQELTGTPFTEVLDENEVDVGEEIINAAGEDGKFGFVEYLWDDPRTDADNVVQADCHNAPDRCAPGTSPKISYVEGTKFPNFTGQENTVFIFGSGIYPEMEEESGDSSDSDDGCAIAGSGNTAENTLFNLFLIVCGLFLAISWKRNRSSAGKA